MKRLWIFDWETYPCFAEVTFLSYKDNEIVTFIIDDETMQNDQSLIIEFIKGKLLVGYNNKTFDDIILNYLIRTKEVCAHDIFKIVQKIISSQNDKTFNFYQEFKQYLKNDSYSSIDLMRLLFSKKLRVSLKELECSLNYENVQELPFDLNEHLDIQKKQEIIEYNINDCKATKLVLEKSLKKLKLRRWIKETYEIDTFSLDGVNGGVKILEVLYERKIGNRDFKEQRTNREFINLKDCILPFIEFKTKSFNDILEKYKQHTWYSKDFDERKNIDNKFKLMPVINNFEFKFSLGGLHGSTQSKIWESNEEYEILAYDVSSYYPREVLEYGFVPEHLNKDVFLEIFRGVFEERLHAKANGHETKNETLKLSINGTYGMFGNKYSWLFDHKVRIQICVNGQLMLAMLIEKFFQEQIQLIDCNTDGIFIYVRKDKKEKVKKIVKQWEEITKMQMEETKFEKIWFLTTADYFGTYYKKDKLETKEKGMFLSEVELGKGMEFPIISCAIKEYFLKNISFEEYIKEHKEILDFCSYKKFNKKYECFHNNIKVQRINRFYPCQKGAYLYKRKFDDKKNRYQTDSVLKDSPIEILNKLDTKDINERNINYGFFISKTRELINQIEGNKHQLTLF